MNQPDAMLIPKSHNEYAIGICERIAACSCDNDDLIEFCFYFNFRLPTIICSDVYNIRLYGLARSRGSKWLLGITDVLDLIQEIRP